ncbi:MAG: glycosyl transferase [Belnapia sp.]|nr:glycosyl transferase [Belnapia sp.]
MFASLPSPLVVMPSRVAQAVWPASMAPRIVIAISGELAAMPWCLRGLLRQRTPEGLLPARGSFGVLLVPLGDAAAARAMVAGMAERLPFPLRLVPPDRPAGPDAAGWAWRQALLAAADWAGPQGILLATTAETVPAPNWLTAHLTAIGAGAEAVAGERQRPDAAGRYGALLRRIAAQLDPQDPCMAGDQASSLAVTTMALAGMPVPADGANGLLAALRRRDARIDSLRDRLVGAAGTASGPAMERLGPACRRWRCRAALRELWEAGIGSIAPETPRLRRWAGRLGLPAGALAGLLGARHFGTAWASVEAASPLLRPRPLPAALLPLETARARLLLAWLRLTRPVQRAGGRAAPGGALGVAMPGICID